MPVRQTLYPGKKGTLRLWRQFGDKLVCVRYREDIEAGKRYKTVELIVDERPGRTAGPAEIWVKLRVAYHEREIRALVKSAGGYWDREKRLWWLRIEEVKRLGLECRVTDRAEQYPGKKSS
ncbi:MAG: hypothetical protein JSW33_01285 [bacterium]|nr:MAG: hypothetical protein JSW33_01285 [bacterium]